MPSCPQGRGGNWPAGELSSTALIFDEELPLPDSSIDRVLMVHSLEFAENPRESLKELWRVLAPGGRLVIVVPNRRGVWARMEHTPFGSGRPYSRSQLTALLRETNFTPGATAEALFFPPTTSRPVLKFRRYLEHTGRRLWPLFSGVIIVEAQKRLYQGLPVTQRASRRVLCPFSRRKGFRPRDPVSIRETGADPRQNDHSGLMPAALFCRISRRYSEGRSNECRA